MKTIPIALLLLGTLSAQEPVRAGDGAFHDARLLSSKTIERYRREVASLMKAHGIPGLSVAVLVDGKLAWADGFGRSDVENSVRAKAITSYRWASVSKAVTATAVMQLVERGKIKLEEDIRTYVPEFPKKEKGTVTVRHLLCHQSGVRHYKGPTEFLSTRPYRNLTEGLETFKDDPLRFEPGSQYGYTTYGYTLLGVAVEKVSGMSFMEYLKKHVFEPAGMKTARDDSVSAIIPHRAQGYVRSRPGFLNSTLADTSYKIPGGGLCGSVLDLAAFVKATLDGRLLKPETFKRMTVRQKTSDGRVRGHGLGWTVGRQNERRVVGHGGAQQRVSAWVGMLPKERLGVVLLCNLERMGGRLSQLSRRLLEIFAETRLKSDF